MTNPRRHPSTTVGEEARRRAGRALGVIKGALATTKSTKVKEKYFTSKGSQQTATREETSHLQGVSCVKHRVRDCPKKAKLTALLIEAEESSKAEDEAVVQDAESHPPSP